MDIYFCDDCGSRVTDADLSLGRGVRRRHIVTCSACVDGSAADRHAAVPAASGADTSDTARLRTVQPDLADAMSGFQALAPPTAVQRPATADLAGDDDDLPVDDGRPVDPKDETAAVPATTPRPQTATSTPPPAKPAPGPAASPAPTRQAQTTARNPPMPAADAKPPAKPATTVVKPPPSSKADTDEVLAPAVGAKRQTTARQPAPNRGGPANQRSTAKASTARNQRPGSGRRGKPLQKQLMLLSILTAAALAGVVGYIAYGNANRQRAQPGEVVIDFNKDLDAIAAAVRTQAKETANKGMAGTKAEVEAAIASIDRLNAKVAEYEKEAKKQGLDDEAIARIMDGKGLQDIRMLRMNLNQIKARMLGSGH